MRQSRLPSPTLQPLPGLEGDFLRAVLALNLERHLVPRLNDGHLPEQVGRLFERFILAMGEAIAFFDPRGGRRAVGQHRLDDRVVRGVFQLDADEATWYQVDRGPPAEEDAEHLEHRAQSIDAG